MFGTPHFIIRDAKLIKQITIKDFDHFVNHDKIFDEHLDRLFGKSLLLMFDEKWRTMRHAMSPVFTSSKMKMLFGNVLECAEDFVKYYEAKALRGKIILDSKEVFARYTVDGISTAALGFKGDCTTNDDSSLYKLAKNIVKPTLATNMKFIVARISRSLYELLRFQLVSKETYDFFHKVIIDVMQHREEKNIFRPDIIQLLMQLKKGQLEREVKEDEANIDNDAKANEQEPANWTDEDFMAQGLIFFFAGSDTTRNLLQVTSFELARNQKIQQELIDEVDEVVLGLNGKS